MQVLGARALPLLWVCLVALSGLVSASAITVGASGYLGDLIGAPAQALIIGIVMAMGLLAWWGITQSVLVAGIVTVIEVLGLFFVIVWGMALSDRLGVPAVDLLPPLQGVHWTGIVGATVLAFFAFIGFEDMVNVAEEVEEPRLTIPKAIVYTLVIATILYLATCIAVLLAVPMEELAGFRCAINAGFCWCAKRSASRLCRHCRCSHGERGADPDNHGVTRALWHGESRSPAHLFRASFDTHSHAIFRDRVCCPLHPWPQFVSTD